MPDTARAEPGSAMSGSALMNLGPVPVPCAADRHEERYRGSSTETAAHLVRHLAVLAVVNHCPWGVWSGSDTASAARRASPRLPARATRRGLVCRKDRTLS